MHAPGPAERLRAARRALMLPHRLGEAGAIAEAFEIMAQALADIHASRPGGQVLALAHELSVYMETAGIEGASARERWANKASGLQWDDKVEISRLVDALADGLNYA